MSDMPWAVEGGCLMCGFSHRYQWPNYSDKSKHKANYVACLNMLVPELSEAFAERDALQEDLNGAVTSMLEASAERDALREERDTWLEAAEVAERDRRALREELAAIRDEWGDVATPYEKDYLRLQAENERLRERIKELGG